MSLRVAMVAPIAHAYDPEGYGPWERVTHDLTEALVARGLDVTLFAPAGSPTSARLVDTVAGPLDSMAGADARLMEEYHLSVAMDLASRGVFDIVHSHLHVHALVFAEHLPCPLISTLHGAAWNEAHHPMLRRYRHHPFVSLSDRERLFLPELDYVATVGNGVDLGRVRPGDGGGEYLAFVGRMAPEKAPDLAVEVARQTGLPLKIAGVAEPRHQDYLQEVLHRADGHAEYLGALSRDGVIELLGSARCLLMPLRWDEPFGLSVVESLAVGTPVVAWRRGSMPEIVEQGVTGFLVDDIAGAVEAVQAVSRLRRADCRRAAEERFSAGVMAEGYESAYRTVLARSSPPAPRRAR